MEEKVGVEKAIVQKIRVCPTFTIYAQALVSHPIPACITVMHVYIYIYLYTLITLSIATYHLIAVAPSCHSQCFPVKILLIILPICSLVTCVCTIELKATVLTVGALEQAP